MGGLSSQGVPVEERRAARDGHDDSGLGSSHTATEPDARFTLANERTFLAWNRTALALVVAGLGIVQLLPPFPGVPWGRHVLGVPLIVLGESVTRLISAAATRPWSLPLAVVLAAALLTLAALWWGRLTAVDRYALGSPQAVARFTALNLPMVVGLASASAGLHIAILAAHGGGTIGDGPRAALYGGVSVYLLASALVPSTKLSRPARRARLVTSLAAMGLVFMGAIVVPVYLVPALAVVLALGLAAEARSAPAPQPV